MPPRAAVMEAGATTPWDQLLDRVDTLVHHRTPLTAEIEAELADLLAAAMRDGVADRELDAGDSARWLAALLQTHAALQPNEARPDEALSTLRVIVTRWLHPGRLDGDATLLDAAL